jgi:hypothetical protein
MPGIFISSNLKQGADAGSGINILIIRALASCELDKEIIKKKTNRMSGNTK